MSQINYMGLTFITNPHLTIASGTKLVDRTWKERLLTTPWRPWKSKKEVTNYLPDPNAYFINSRIVAIHPTTLNVLKNELEALGRKNSVGFRMGVH